LTAFDQRRRKRNSLSVCLHASSSVCRLCDADRLPIPAQCETPHALHPRTEQAQFAGAALAYMIHGPQISLCINIFCIFTGRALGSQGCTTQRILSYLMNHNELHAFAARPQTMWRNDFIGRHASGAMIIAPNSAYDA